MEINGKYPPIDQSVRPDRIEVQEPQKQRLQKTDSGTAVTGQDRVELSVRSREIQNLDQMIQATPDVREGLVERIRQSLTDGTYNVKAEQVADKIIGGSLIDQIF
jgi:negative regulator of flagellin synthesis FlgM